MSAKKDQKKKVKAKLKTLAKARGLRELDKIPPNKVTPDKSKDKKEAARLKEIDEFLIKLAYQDD